MAPRDKYEDVDAFRMNAASGCAGGGMAAIGRMKRMTEGSSGSSLEARKPTFETSIRLCL